MPWRAETVFNLTRAGLGHDPYSYGLDKWVPEALAVSGFPGEDTLGFDNVEIVMREPEPLAAGQQPPMPEKPVQAPNGNDVAPLLRHIVKCGVPCTVTQLDDLLGAFLGMKKFGIEPRTARLSDVVFSAGAIVASL